MICDKSKCTGCFACYNICPKNAIEMIEDENGFLYPEIDNKKCINCGLCKKVCPSLNEVDKKYPQKCFAAYSKNKDIRNKSTSGGIATVLSQEIINDGGVVYGSAFTDKCCVEHIRVTQIEDLHQLQGSKYVHSYIKDCYKNVKTDLKDKTVLFIGTPCQIAGLKKYLMKDYDNLLLIDIICHGVPSQKYLQEEVKRIVGNINVDRVNFRNGNTYGLYPIKDNKILNGSDIQNSPYSDAFMSGISLRENCFSCSYAGANRISDITIGDFWGLDKSSIFYKDKENGVSVIFINTEKGAKYFNIINNLFEIESRPIEEAIIGNTQLMHPVVKNKNVDKFRKLCNKYNFEKAYKKVTKIKRFKSKVKNILKKLIKK